MWPFDRLQVRLKLGLLAGVPVIGALLLSTLLARDAQERAQTAAALGSVEDLAQLTEKMTGVVESLQSERAQAAYSAGTGQLEGTELSQAEFATDRSLGALQGFLAVRDENRLPAQLRGHLKAAREQLARLVEARRRTHAGQFAIDEHLEYYAETNDSLISATSALTQLSDDGQLLLSISRLVAALQLIERNSREHALLSYVFAKSEFPPGSFRYFVTLLTEQAVYMASLRTSADDQSFKHLQKALKGNDPIKIAAMRKSALETTEETLSVNARDWFETQRSNMQGQRRVAQDMAAAVRFAASAKVSQTRAAVRLSIGLAVGVLTISTLLAWAIARGLTRSVRVLSNAASAVQRNGDFSLRAEKTSRDELGLLTDAFNGMLAGIQHRDQELTTHRENLEALVAARTLELSLRNQQMRLVLDNVEQGLVMIDRQGKLAGECSRVFAQTFGPVQAGTSFNEALTRDDGNMSFVLESAYEQLLSDVLPTEVAIDQMPKLLERGDRRYSLTFTAVMREDKPDGALLVVRDITAELAALQAEALQREQIQIFQHVMRDRCGFLDFFKESSQLCERIFANSFASPAEKLRGVHTLKGTTALLQVQSVAGFAHELEQTLVDGDFEAEQKAIVKLRAAWTEFERRVLPLLGDDGGERVEVTQREFGEVLSAVRNNKSHAVLERLLVRLQYEPASLRFKRLEEQLVYLAQRLGKARVQVVTDGDGLRLPVTPFRDFWMSFAHVIRNIADHGMQTEEERAEHDKPPCNRIALSVRSTAEALVLEISDDGAGIDWQKLAERARAQGLGHETREQLVDALFCDGVSTADEVTETSGRGVGLASLLAACKALQAHVSVESETGQGTRFRFRFPPIDGADFDGAEHFSTAPGPSAATSPRSRPPSLHVGRS